MENHIKKFVCDGVNIHYVEAGSGNPMIFLHGFGGSHYTWRNLMREYSGHYRVIAIDLKGFGYSDKPEFSDYSITAQSKIVEKFILDNELKNLTLVGNSLGGAVALLAVINLQETRRDLIDSLILLDSAGYHQDFPFFVRLLRIPVLNKLLLALVPGKLSVRMVLGKGFFDRSSITDEMVDTYASYMKLDGARASMIATCKNIVPIDNESIIMKYRQIKVPVLIIWGEHDKVIPLDIGVRLSREIPNSTFRLIKNCGHMPQEECPKESLNLINDFLNIKNQTIDSA